MMMKLMKFLVVALVAGGVCAPVPSQAGEVDGKAIMCELDPSQIILNTDEHLAQGAGLVAYSFKKGRLIQKFVDRIQRPRKIITAEKKPKYFTTDSYLVAGRGQQSALLFRPKDTPTQSAEKRSLWAM